MGRRCLQWVGLDTGNPPGIRHSRDAPGADLLNRPLGWLAAPAVGVPERADDQFHNGKLFVSKLGFFEVTKVPSSRLAP